MNVDNRVAAAEGCDAVGETLLKRLDHLVGLCADDGEFMLLARHWTGRLRLGIGDRSVDLRLRNGAPIALADSPPGPLADEPGLIGLSGEAELWERILAPVPEPFYNDVVPAQA